MQLNSKNLPQFKTPPSRLRRLFLVTLISVMLVTLAYGLREAVSDDIEMLIQLPTSTSVPKLNPTSPDAAAVAPAGDTPTTVGPEAAAALPPNTFYLSVAKDSAQTLGSATEVRDEDILSYDGLNFAIIFDGSAAGLPARVGVDAFHVVDADTILISVDKPVTIDQLQVDGSDIVKFEATSLGLNNTAGTFNLFFDGSTVGLTTNRANVDALTLLPDGTLLISTEGRVRVAGVSGNIRTGDEDILAFTPFAPGDYSSGAWSLYFDGSNAGLRNGSENIDGLAIGASGEIYLTTTGNFSVKGIDGRSDDIFSCTPTALGNSITCNFSTTLFFDGSEHGLSRNDIDAISVP